jgi:hypothetical protein
LCRLVMEELTASMIQEDALACLYARVLEPPRSQLPLEVVQVPRLVFMKGLQRLSHLRRAPSPRAGVLTRGYLHLLRRSELEMHLILARLRLPTDQHLLERWNGAIFFHRTT